jgi:hypothetical protein
MVDPTPLFDDDDGAKPARRAPVMPTLLDLDNAPERPKPAATRFVQAIGEDPQVAVALARGEKLFPALLKSHGHLIRNRLGDLLPLDFARLSGFGRDTLDRSSRLTMAVAALNARFHALDPEALVTGIVAQAKVHAMGAKRTGFRAMLTGLVPFDAGEARARLEALRGLTEALLRDVSACVEDIGRLDLVIRTEVAALAILNDLADHGTMGDLLNRCVALIDAAAQELTIAARQGETLRRLAEQWIMRIDETRDATLPALGFTAGF